MVSSTSRFGRSWLVATLLCCFFSTSCRRGAEVRRIGILMGSPRLADAAWALRRNLADTSARRPWSVEFFQLEPERGDEALAAAARRIADSGVEVIVAVTTAAAVAAHREVDGEIPIVFCLVSDPVAAGLVEEQARPGGNVTGVLDSGAFLAGKRLEYLVRAHPGARRVLVVYTASVVSASILEELRLAAVKLDVELVEILARDREQVSAVYREVRPGAVDAVYVPSDVVIGMGEEALRDLVRRDSVPTIIGGNDSHAAVFGFGTSASESGAQAAVLVAKILDGIPPGDLPLEPPRHPKLRLFLSNARAMGYAFEEAAFWLADELVDE